MPLNIENWDTFPKVDSSFPGHTVYHCLRIDTITYFQSLPVPSFSSLRRHSERGLCLSHLGVSSNQMVPGPIYILHATSFFYAKWRWVILLSLLASYMLTHLLPGPWDATQSVPQRAGLQPIRHARPRSALLITLSASISMGSLPPIPSTGKLAGWNLS